MDFAAKGARDLTAQAEKLRPGSTGLTTNGTSRGGEATQRDPPRVTQFAARRRLGDLTDVVFNAPGTLDLLKSLNTRDVFEWTHLQ